MKINISLYLEDNTAFEQSTAITWQRLKIFSQINFPEEANRRKIKILLTF